MRRFFLDNKTIRDNRIIIDGQEAHHIKDVIRLKVGDRFLGLDGAGKVYTLRIRSLTDKVEAEIEKVSSKCIDVPKVLLACALPKKSKIDYIVEKATELGVSEIVPMITERTIVKVDKKSRASKQRRWDKIAVEASKQCGRDTLPKIYEPMNFKDALNIAGELGYARKIMPCLCEGTRSLDKALSGSKKDVAIFIGPEGDFTRQETGLARDNNCDPVSLGPLVLKVDTACIFTVSVVMGRFS
ncbi:MAG: 16S rRNA (uracil(1498)-N(3))-methyltransferase [Candidatus Omnitrophica bacterium]|nr:16S rRNA (uracil(1498)-N(3))-methyltransferase [Candidatus Omnitrophota bacterium]